MEKDNITIKLPQYLITSELLKSLKGKEPNEICKTIEKFNFNWSKVLFFDDYALLKLLFLQRYLRVHGKKVKNTGFAAVYTSSNRQAVLRQLWNVGLPELIASGNFFGVQHLKEALKDESEILESNPFVALESSTERVPVIPMLCCHDLKYFASGSREEKHLDAFIRTALKPSEKKYLTWDIIESRDFRHLMLQQLRRNVQEHSNVEENAAIGIAIVRVWTCNSLSQEWNLTKEMTNKLLKLWRNDPLPSILPNLDDDCGILQISVIDNGTGIPNNLSKAHGELLKSGGQQEFFRRRYGNKAFEKRFEEPSKWKDDKAMLIAFATDWLGTSKSNRPQEIKGLEYLRKKAVIEKNGAALIESDGGSISQFSKNHAYGQSSQQLLRWCENGGTGICLAVPMKPVETSFDEQKWDFHTAEHMASAYTGSNSELLKIRDHLDTKPSYKNPSKKELTSITSCGKLVVEKINLPECSDDISIIREKGLLIIDFGGLQDSKSIFHSLFLVIANELAITEPKQMRPFVFANLPKGLCGLLGKAIKSFSKKNQITPILVFTAEHVEPYWLGLDSSNLIPNNIRPHVPSKIKRKLTDQKENRSEAFYRDCMANFLCVSKPTSLLDSSILVGIDTQFHQPIQQSTAFTHFDKLINRCSLFREEQKPSHVDGKMVYTGSFQPIFRIENIVSEVRTLFLDKFREVFTSPPVCFEPRNKKEGIRLPHSRRISARYFRSDALVDHPIAGELIQELISIALGMAKQMPNKRIDWIVSCTSPPHWFVHRIVDGLSDYGMFCSHFVFPSFEEIPASMENIDMHSSDSVLIFTAHFTKGYSSNRNDYPFRGC